MNKGIDYVICAAGAGQRMQELAGGRPKPLIEMLGRTLLEISIESLDLYPSDRLIIVVQKAHQVKKELEKKFSEKYPLITIEWIEIDGLTKGQLETAYLAKKYFRADAGLVIFNSDTYFRSAGLNAAIQSGSFDGIIPCSKQAGDAWSFCKTDASLSVEAVAEKKRISDWCSVGFYYFKSPKVFSELAAEALAKKTEEKEYYVAPLYNALIKQGAKVAVNVVDAFLPMGSEDQIKEFWKISKQQIQHSNSRGTIVVDLDDTITVDASSGEYENKKPNQAIVDKMQEYRKMGFQIVIASSRRMRTHKNDEAKILAEIAKTTVDWLQKHNVPFDGLRFGKPFAANGFYVDDKAVRPSEFLKFSYDELMEKIKE